jgi:hypothetical protein
MQKAIIFNTCGTVRKFLAEQWIRSARSVRPYCLESRPDCCEVILIIEANKTHYFSTLLWWTALQVSDRFTVHHQQSQYCIHSNWYLSYWLRWLSASEVRSLSETCRVVFQNKVGKLCIFLAFIIRICDDARSAECQMLWGR